MKVMSACVFGLTFVAACTVCIAQVDIYQSDAYSVEEMCAREAEQSDSEDYGSAYESCIEENRNNSMYRPDQGNSDHQDRAEESVLPEPDGYSTTSTPFENNSIEMGVRVDSPD